MLLEFIDYMLHLKSQIQISHLNGHSLNCDRTYSEFKQLNDQINAAFANDKSYSAASVSAEFPPEHSGILSFGISETQLSERFLLNKFDFLIINFLHQG